MTHYTSMIGLLPVWAVPQKKAQALPYLGQPMASLIFVAVSA